MSNSTYMYHLHLPPEGDCGVIRRVSSLDHPLGGTVQSSGKVVGVFPYPYTTCHGVSQIIYNNV